MTEPPYGFAAAQALIRWVPNGLRGKTRLGRWLLRPFLDWSPAQVLDAAGNRFSCPSLEEPVAAGIFTFGQYERDTACAILCQLPIGGLFIDVGANIGAVTIPIAAQRPDVRIVSIEADPAIAAILRQNISALTYS